MGKTIWVIFFCFQMSNILGQKNIPFPLSNTTWKTDLQTQGDGPPYPPPISHVFRYFKTNGDTLLNGFQYTVIDRSDFSNYCLIRQEHDTVFCKYFSDTPFDTAEFILYDFSVQLGDTVQLPMSGNPIHYYEGFVTSVDSILIGNQYRKRIGIGSWISFEFIEGIGSLQGLLYPEIPWVDFWADLTCFSKNDTIFSLQGDGHTSLGNCWQTIGIERVERSTPTIYPNPASASITIVLPPELGRQDIQVYNATGRLMKVVTATSPVTLHVADWPSGLYYVRVGDGWEWVGKFVRH